MTAALALVSASPDLSPARAALVTAYAERDSVARAQRTIASARERLAGAIAARTEAKGVLEALATYEAERLQIWSLDGKGDEPKPDIGKRRELEGALDDARVRADAAQTSLDKLKVAAEEGERRMQAAEHAVTLALSAVRLEELEAEFERVEGLFAKARAEVRNLVKLAGTIQDISAAAHKPRAASIEYRAHMMMAPAPEQFIDLGDFSAAQRAVERLTTDLRTEPTATLSLD